MQPAQTKHHPKRFKALKERVNTLFAAIEHGSDKHRAWLKRAIDQHFAGQPVDKPEQ